jgi:hypothetical protein
MGVVPESEARETHQLRGSWALGERSSMSLSSSTGHNWILIRCSIFSLAFSRQYGTEYGGIRRDILYRDILYRDIRGPTAVTIPRSTSELRSSSRTPLELGAWTVVAVQLPRFKLDALNLDCFTIYIRARDHDQR